MSSSVLPSPHILRNPMAMNLVGQESEPPPYEESAHSPRSSVASGYAPVRYNLPGQDPQEFYEVLIDASNHPSEIFCRMADALFFHMDRCCNQFRNTQHIEPAKIAWLGVILGQDAGLSMVVQQHLPFLYDAASIPYTFNSTQTPILDRRGLLHLCVFEARADPPYALQKWNKTLNVLKLRDPLTNLPFPRPIPCSAFPSVSDSFLNQVYTNWKMKTASQVSHRTPHAMSTQGTVGNNVLHASSTAQVRRAVSIARQSASQTVHQFDRLQRIQAEKLMELESSQNVQVQASKMARMVEEADRERNNSPRTSPTPQVRQAVPIARLAAFQTVQQFEKLQTPGAKSTETQLESLQDAQDVLDTQAAPSRVPGGSREEELNKGRNNGLYKSPTAQIQQAISFARRAAVQTVRQTKRLQKNQAPGG